MKPSDSFAKPGFGDGINMCSKPSGYTQRHPIHGRQAKPPPFSYYSVVAVVPRWVLPHQAPTTRACKHYVITSLLTRAKPFARFRASAKTCSIAMSRDNPDESTRMLGSDAPLLEPQ